MTYDETGAVLALVGSQESEPVGQSLPVPPIGASLGAQALWYALLGEYQFNLAEMALLEQLVSVKTYIDEVEDDWRADGSPTTARGSQGQPVADPRIQEVRQLRAQFAALIKQLAIPAEGSEAKRRPGRPTRINGGGRWS